MGDTLTKVLTRRSFSKTVIGAAAWLTAPWRNVVSAENASSVNEPIDRRALVTRHNVTLAASDIMSPLSVGNGEFAFTADVTGLQTFAREYRDGIPLGTMAQWGFHTAPNPQGFSLEKFPLTYLETGGRKVGYLYYEDKKSPPELSPAASYLYSNPGRFNLGQVGMALKHRDGREARLSDLTDIGQELNLLTGRLVSQFTFDGQQVRVLTACHPHNDQLAVRITSPLIASGQLCVLLTFPYAATAFGGDGADWNHPDAHQSVLTRAGTHRADFARTLDSDNYHAAMEWSGNATLSEHGPHQFHLCGASGSSTLQFTVAFAPHTVLPSLPNVDDIASASETMWIDFWSAGGAIDLSQSKDSRWKELERRIVLSQYLTRIQCAGSLPPQETGLTCNSWFGKFHLEMHWWHAAHFALWGRHDLLERSLPFYERILPKAQAQAKKQGYEGARWPKCVGPAGEPAPTYLECFLIWQQPHPIFYAELCYRANRTPKTLMKYREIVFETAKFMASFAVWDPDRGQYRIGPPIADAAEIYFGDHDHQWNPTFEVAYWRSGLETAQRWRQRLGLGRDAHWDHVISHLPPLATRNGVYVAAETATGTFEDPGQNTSHPCMLAPFGMLDGAMADPKVMRATLLRIMKNWDWKNTWGWDYPMMAMTAARVGEGGKAVDALLMSETKNTYLSNGHNFQMEHILPIYLPGNGGLLYAVSMMAAGWEGAPKKHAPGFPDDGSWTVRWEGLEVAP
jgi:hypothetical protein